MTLTLAAPNADPIRTYRNGLKVVRMHEYLGAARGTLTTVVDTYAVAGHAVKDEQTIATPTTFADQWANVDDTVTIPVADFDYPADSVYIGFLALRCEGRPPVLARAGEKFNVWQSNATPNVWLGWDGTVQRSGHAVPREHYENYTMIRLGSFGPAYDGGSTNINIRAWGIAGGATTFAWYLDCLYLVPLLLKSTDTLGALEPGGGQWFIGQDVVNPLLPATDVDPNTQLDIRSTFTHPKDSVINWGGGFDIQDSDGEDTEFDWPVIGFFSDPDLEKSYIYWVGLCSRLINPHVLENADFSDTGPDPTPTGPFDQTYVTPEGYQMLVDTTGVVGEFYFADGVMRFRSLMYPSEFPPFSNPYPLATDRSSIWSMGAWTHNINTYLSTDPRTYTPQMDSLESFVLTLKTMPIDGIPASGIAYNVYGERWTGENTRIDRVLFGPYIDIANTGAATVQFVFQANNFVSAAFVGDSVSVPDNLGNDFWIKLEKKLYIWRVKIWLDGDPEPVDWLLQTNEPASVLNSITGAVTLEYPWDTGYPVAGSTVEVHSPNRLPDEIPNGTSGDRGWTVGGNMILKAGFNITTGWRIDTSPIIVEYDPDSEDDGVYTGANFRIEKYDESEQWGQVHVQQGQCRVAFSDYAPHHFNSSADSGNSSVWKDSGGHPLQTAAYSTMFFRRYVQGGVIPLFRPRVFSVSAA